MSINYDKICGQCINDINLIILLHNNFNEMHSLFQINIVTKNILIVQMV